MTRRVERSRRDRGVTKVGHDGVSEAKGPELSVFGDVFDATPMVLPGRGHLDTIKRPPKGDLYIGRGSRQRSLARSRYCKTFKVSQHGRVVAILGFRDALISDRKLHSSLWALSGRRLVCHCRPSEACHGDVLIEEFRKLYPDSYDRSAGHGAPPESGVLSYIGQIARGTGQRRGIEFR